MKILLDGVPIPASEFSTKLKITENFSSKKNRTEEFEFYGSAMQTIFEVLVKAENALLNTIEVQIFDDCCGDELVMLGELKGGSLSFKESDCFVKAIVYEKDPFLDCLKSQIISEGITANKARPVIGVQKELNTFQRVLVTIAMFTLCTLIPVLLITEFVEETINILRTIASILPGVKKPEKKWDVPSIDDLPEVLTALEYVYFHPTPTIREYIESACQACGEQHNKTYAFKSTIFNDNNSPYYNAVYFEAGSDRGYENKSNVVPIDANAPRLSASDFMDLIAEGFNSKWWTEDNLLYFERKDFSLEKEPHDFTAEDVAYDISENDVPAYFSFEYTKDYLDGSGNEKVSDYNYRHDWNDPKAPAQVGKHSVPFRVAMAKIDTYDSPVSSVLRTLTKAFLKNYTPRTLTGYFVKAENLKMSVPKILLTDGSKLIKDQSPMFGANMYQNFHAIDDPRGANYQYISFSLEIPLNCETRAKKGDPVTIRKLDQIQETFISEITTDYGKGVQNISGLTK